MERGEWTAAAAGPGAASRVQKTSWLEQKSISLLVQLGMEKHPDLPHVPMLLDFASTLEQRQVLKLVLASLVLGRPIFAPPEIPRTAVTRCAPHSTPRCGIHSFSTRRRSSISRSRQSPRPPSIICSRSFIARRKHSGKGGSNHPEVIGLAPHVNAIEESGRP
jgi:hypothetical protein